ncbi:hypothetical protein EC991_000496 [Linnemannia zychae]|nr:hypothetical protein EC991_000496 [Linnemannia zychae]
MSSARPLRTAKLNASDKIKDQMDQLLLLAQQSRRKGHLDDSKPESESSALAKPERRKRRPTDDLSDTEQSTIAREATVAGDKDNASRRSQSRSKKQKADDGKDANRHGDSSSRNKAGLIELSSSTPAEPKRKPGRPKKLRTTQETTEQAASTTKVPSSRRPRKLAVNTSESDSEEPFVWKQQHQSQEQMQEEIDFHINSSGSDYRSDGSDSEDGAIKTYGEDTPKTVRKRTSREGKGKGKAGDDTVDGSMVGRRRSRRSLTELQRAQEVKEERVQQRDRRKQEILDAKDAKAKAKEAKKLQRIRRSYLSLPASVQLAQAVQHLVLEEEQDNQGKRRKQRKQKQQAKQEKSTKRIRKARSVKWDEEDEAFVPSNLIYQVLRPEKRGFSYRWPIREELLHTVPVPAFTDEASEPDYFEEQGLGFVEELAGVPKVDDDYSDTDMESDNSGSDENIHNSSTKERGKHGNKRGGENESENESEGEEDEDVGSGEETARERRLRRQRRKRTHAAMRSRKLEGLLERQESMPRSRHERHEDERFANARLEAVQGFFNGEMARFAQMQYQKGIPERVQDLDKFLQSMTLPEDRRPTAVPVRAPIGSDLAGFDQEDKMTRIQQRAIAFSAEDALRKTLDRMVYVVRQGSLLRMPEYYNVATKASNRRNYERGWDTVMTSAAMAGIDDRILKKVSMRMKKLLSKSLNPHYHEAGPEGQWATGEDAVARERKKYEEGDDKKEDEHKFVDPMDPEFDPLVVQIRAEYRRRRFLADAKRRKKLREEHEASGSGLQSGAPDSMSGSEAEMSEIEDGSG